MKKWIPKELPIEKDFETKLVLKKATKAHKALAELKGVAISIPNQEILINSINIKEAKDSSEIENIVTTHDEIFKSELNLVTSLSSKEVRNYIEALREGFSLVSKDGILKNSTILKIQEKLEKNKAGFRKVPGTALKNSTTGETVYEPPQDYKEILQLMQNLETFINDEEISDLDPLVKMAIIHFQFESIHPFYDGNGRTGRIINILYLIVQELLDLPILYLSSYIIRNKAEYYRLLQLVRDEDEWQPWILYMLEAVEVISLETIKLIGDIKRMMQMQKLKLRATYRFYSQDLLNNLFKYPYTKIEYLCEDLGVSRITSANYLNKLSEDGFLAKYKSGKSNYYVNEQFYNLLIKRNRG